MKLEEVLQHLRTGGLVTIRGVTTFNLEQVLNLSSEALRSDWFIIVNKPYISESIIECNKEGYICAGDISLPDASKRKNKKYKIVVEEIK